MIRSTLVKTDDNKQCDNDIVEYYENMITVTLSPELLKYPVLTQLNKSYDFIRRYFKSGKGTIEFTKKGNIHYHIKTQDDEFDVLQFIDELKIKYFRSGRHNERVFGFVKCDITSRIERYMNYDYLLKDNEKTLQLLKRLKIEKFIPLWDYEEPKPKIIRIINLRDILNDDPFEDDIC